MHRTPLHRRRKSAVAKGLYREGPQLCGLVVGDEAVNDRTRFESAIGRLPDRVCRGCGYRECACADPWLRKLSRALAGDPIPEHANCRCVVVVRDDHTWLLTQAEADAAAERARRRLCEEVFRNSVRLLTQPTPDASSLPPLE